MADITLGQILHTDANEPFSTTSQGDGTYSLDVTQVGSNVAYDETEDVRKVRQSGNLDKLAEITSNTTVTAGSLITPVGKEEQLDYKEVRASVRWSSSTDFRLRLLLRTDDDLAVGAENATFTGEQIGNAILGDVKSNYFKCAIYNDGASDTDVTFAVFLGVR